MSLKNVGTIHSVVKTGLCTGCGTCAGICPRGAIEMIVDRVGLYAPSIRQDQCSDCGLCLEVCPGHSVDFRQLSQTIFGGEADDGALGHCLDCHIGHATNYEVRYHSASGGLVTALLAFALEEKMIDGALVTRMRGDRPLEPQPFIARTRDEIVSAARSKYCPVPANVVLKEILKAGENERFAVVGLPCHIQGVRKAETAIKKLRGKIALQFGLVCSHSDSFHETDFLLRKYGLNKEDVAGIDYRGPGWPGYLTIRTRHGTEKAVPFDEYITAHAGYFFTPRRCTLCCDMSARLSDMAFMDAWLPEVRARDNLGTSIVVCRTDRGLSLLRRAGLGKHVDLKELPGTDALRSQGSARMSNRDLKAHTRFARLRGRSVPDYNIYVPRSGPRNYLRALVIYLNMWVSSRRWLYGLINPLIQLESRVIGRAKGNI